MKNALPLVALGAVGLYLLTRKKDAALKDSAAAPTPPLSMYRPPRPVPPQGPGGFTSLKNPAFAKACAGETLTGEEVEFLFSTFKDQVDQLDPTKGWNAFVVKVDALARAETRKWCGGKAAPEAVVDLVKNWITQYFSS